MACWLEVIDFWRRFGGIAVLALAAAVSVPSVFAALALALESAFEAAIDALPSGAGAA